MAEDRTPKTEPELASGAAEAAPERDKRRARELYRDLDGPVDERFKQSLAGFSRRLGERAAQQPQDPQAAALARKAALQEYDQAHVRRLKMIGGGVGAAVFAASVASLIVFIGSPDQPVPAAATAKADRTTVVEVAASQPVPDPGPPPPAPVAPAPPALTPVVASDGSAQAAPTMTDGKRPVEPVAVTPAPEPAPLRREEVREVQAMLRSFGFNPGPIDGTKGPMTYSAVVQYREKRGLAPIADIDRELLDQLRQDPAPKVQVAQAPPARQPAAYASQTAPPATSSNPFDAMRRDFARVQQSVQQWFQSIGR